MSNPGKRARSWFFSLTDGRRGDPTLYERPGLDAAEIRAAEDALVDAIGAAKTADLIANEQIETIYGGPKTIVDNWK